MEYLTPEILGICYKAVLAVLLLVMLVRQGSIAKQQKKEADALKALFSGLRGKIEVLERDFNQVRTKVLRSESSTQVDLEDTVVIAVEEKKTLEELVFPENVIPLDILENKIELTTASVQTGLKKTRSGFFSKLKSALGLKSEIDSEVLEQLESILIESDLGVKTATKLIEEIKSEVLNGAKFSENDFIERLKSKLTEILKTDSQIKEVTSPEVILVVGVNGVGKTTSAAKLAKLYSKQGKKVLLAAADTFRAAAVEQIKEWGTRLEIEVVSGADNAKPQTVVFDALTKAQNENYEVVIIDTAGRLHNKSNLMLELEGIRNVVSKFKVEGPDQVIMVVDGNTGQNAISQAKEFNEATKLTGLIVTKLDGTPKGGVVVAIKQELGIPVEYIGIGEGADDLKIFNAKEFIDALLDSSDVEPVTDSLNALTRRRRREANGD